MSASMSKALDALEPYLGLMVGRSPNRAPDDPPNELYCLWCYQAGLRSPCAVRDYGKKLRAGAYCQNPAHPDKPFRESLSWEQLEFARNDLPVTNGEAGT